MREQREILECTARECERRRRHLVNIVRDRERDKLRRYRRERRIQIDRYIDREGLSEKRLNMTE